MIRSLIPALLLLSATPAFAQEPGAALVPAQVAALSGCWSGSGDVMGKPVVLNLTATPVAHGALFVVESDSHATADPTDRYAAHLVFGGRTPGDTGETLTGFWSDSFGGDYTATGTGTVRFDGFDITYPYPDARFLNRWTRDGDRLSWTIVAVSASGAENSFANYALTRTTCG